MRKRFPIIPVLIAFLVAPLTGVAIGHGTGASPGSDALKGVRAPVLGLYGGDDARVNTTVGPVEAKMKEMGKTDVTHTYPGGGHGFLRVQDDRDGANRAASDKAWPATIEHLKKYLFFEPPSG